jgi:hypothetical protein
VSDGIDSDPERVQYETASDEKIMSWIIKNDVFDGFKAAPEKEPVPEIKNESSGKID